MCIKSLHRSTRIHSVDSQKRRIHFYNVRNHRAQFECLWKSQLQFTLYKYAWTFCLCVTTLNRRESVSEIEMNSFFLHGMRFECVMNTNVFGQRFTNWVCVCVLQKRFEFGSFPLIHVFRASFCWHRRSKCHSYFVQHRIRLLRRNNQNRVQCINVFWLLKFIWCKYLM